MKIAVVANTSWYLYNFRRNLIRAVVEAGHDVIAVAPHDDYTSRLGALCLGVRDLPLHATSTNPLRELGTVAALIAALRSERVDMVLSDTPKGNLYSAMACAVTGAQQVANISGLGRAFVRESLLTEIVKRMYQVLFRKTQKVFFQNTDDLDYFLAHNLVSRARSEHIPGVGVDLQHFAPRETSQKSSEGTFLLVGRMLWSKGAGEFVQAARIVKATHAGARFQLLGFVDDTDADAVPSRQLTEWHQEGVVEYLGVTDDIRASIAAADCIVLPSFYREGVPRSLMEGAAMGKPLIATDVNGCRDTVDDGVTGFLCRARDSRDLAAKMTKMLDLSPEARDTMGKLGREKMAAQFDELVVIQRYLREIEHF